VKKNAVTEAEQTLVVQQLLSSLGGVLGIGRLDDGVDGTGLLAEAAVDALGHVDVVLCCPSRPVGPLLGLDGDGLGRTDLWRLKAVVSTHSPLYLWAWRG